MIIYNVMATGGMYDDFYDEPLGSYDNRESAVEHITYMVNNKINSTIGTDKEEVLYIRMIKVQSEFDSGVFKENV